MPTELKRTIRADSEMRRAAHLSAATDPQRHVGPGRRAARETGTCLMTRAPADCRQREDQRNTRPRARTVSVRRTWLMPTMLVLTSWRVLLEASERLFFWLFFEAGSVTRFPYVGVAKSPRIRTAGGPATAQRFAAKRNSTPIKGASVRCEVIVVGRGSTDTFHRSWRRGRYGSAPRALRATGRGPSVGVPAQRGLEIIASAQGPHGRTLPSNADVRSFFF